MLVLDEINTAVNLRLVNIEKLINLIINPNPQMEAILTGQERIPELIAISDYRTRLVEEKQPFQKGQNARIGIEY